MSRQILCGFSLVVLLLVGSSARAATFGWDGAGANNLWTTSANWLPNGVPGLADVILLAGTSAPGPQTIDLGGGTQRIDRLQADGVGGTYTLTNGTLEFFGNSSLNAVLTDSGGGGFTFDNDLLFAVATERLLNVVPDGDPIVVNGDVSTSAASGTMTLNLTSRNLTHVQSVTVNGVIADGTGAAMALNAGLASDAANHRGLVAVTALNTFTGPTHINGAILEINSIADFGGAPNALGQPTVEADSVITIGTTADADQVRGTLRYVGPGHTTNRDISLTGKDNDSAAIEASGTGSLVLNGDILNPVNGQTIVFSGTNTGNNTFSGEIKPGVGSDVTSVHKESSGKWILSGSSPIMDGSIRVSTGELELTGAIGSTTSTAGGFLLISSGEFTLDDGYMAVSGFNASAGGMFNFQSGTVRVSAPTSPAGTFAVPLTVGADGDGTLQLQAGNINMNDITLQGVGDTLEITGGTWGVNKIDNLNGGAINFTDGEINLNVAGQGLTTGAGIISGKLSGVGDVTKVGGGTLTIDGNTHDHSGKLNINSGVVDVTTAGRLSDGATIDVKSGASLRFLTTSGDAIFGLEGAGNVELGDAGLVLGNSTVPGSSGGVGTFTGTMSDGPGAAIGSLEKRGSGTFTFAGTSTHTGFTEVENGTMIVSGTIANTSNVRVPNGPLAGAGRLILDGGTINSAGKVTADQTGARLDINSGSLTATQIDVVAGTAYNTIFTWTAGNIHLTGAGGVNVGVAAGTDQPFQNSLDLTAGKTLEIDNTTTIGASGSLSINGGVLKTGSLANDSGGTFAFNSGVLSFTQDQTFNAAGFKKLDVDGLIQAGRTLEVATQATIDIPLVLAGGVMRFGTVVNPENLILDSGTLEVTGGDLQVLAGKSIDVTSGMTLNVTNGELDVASGGELNAINATLTTSGAITNDGDVNLINSTVNGGLVNGTGGSANLLGSNSFNGDLELSSSSSLFIDIGGDQLGEFDVVTVSGNSTATLDGSINVLLNDGFFPSPGQQFTVLTASSITDNGLALAGSAAGQFDLLIGGSSVVLQAIGADVDLNNDGDVDGADFLAIQRTNPALISAWELQYGSGLPLIASSTSVPEPTSAVLAFVAVTIVGVNSRSRKARS